MAHAEASLLSVASESQSQSQTQVVDESQAAAGGVNWASLQPSDESQVFDVSDMDEQPILR